MGGSTSGTSRPRQRRLRQLAGLIGLAWLTVYGVAPAVSSGGAPKAAPAAAATPRAQKDVVIGGVRWLGSLEQARKVAARENKPILFFSLFGRLDEGFC